MSTYDQYTEGLTLVHKFAEGEGLVSLLSQDRWDAIDLIMST